MDFAVLGPERAEAGLVLVSGTHGVEGFCGSASQTGLLREGQIKAYAERLRVVLVHAHNPYGFAWLRRVNEDNVDLNRNYIDHLRPYPEHPIYDELKDDIAPATISGAAFEAATARLRAYSVKHGAFALQQASRPGNTATRPGSTMAARSRPGRTGPSRPRCRAFSRISAASASSIIIRASGRSATASSSANTKRGAPATCASRPGSAARRSRRARANPSPPI